MTNVTTQGIPESISREAYRELVKHLGIDPKHLLTLEFRWDVVYAEIWAFNKHGNHVIDGETAAVHTIAIPIDDHLEKP